MAATVTEAMTPIPPDPIQECLKFVGVYAAGATRFMESHQLVTLENILLFCPRKSKYLMKIYNRQ